MPKFITEVDTYLYTYISYELCVCVSVYVHASRPI